MKNKTYKIMSLLTILFTLTGIIALIPDSGASYPNILMYKSICTFTPGGSLYCFFLAGLTCYLRAALVKDKEGTPRQRLLARKRAWIPLLILLTLAIVSTYQFARIKAPYLDGSTTASFENEK